ncbi:MAG: TetR/AcrR family transcriptional regulator [Eubacteriales bacterium]|nr:TetR/AcrR family transcriptional regulator [Eubacteriales bacterium]
MGEKSAQKKQYIREVARRVFMEKGFKDVTMKDIVEACHISRGGLYLYYSGTQEIFLDVLKMETQETDDVFAGALSRSATAADILELFLCEQKKELLRQDQTLAVATYEYAFLANRQEGENYLGARFQEAQRIIEQLIQLGVRNGEFVCSDPKGAAGNIMLALEGLKIAARTMGVTEEAVDREIRYLLHGLSAGARGDSISF